MLIIAEETRAADQEAQDKREMKKQLSRLDRERAAAAAKNNASPALAQINSGIHTLEQVEHKIDDEGMFRYAAFRAESDDAQKQAQEEYSKLANCVSQFSSSPFPNLPSVKLPTGTVTLSSDGTRIGAKFKFGSYISTGISAGQVDSVTTEVTTFFALFDRIKSEVGWRTQYTPDGVLNGPVFGARVEEKRPSFSTKPYIDEKPDTALPKLPIQ